MRSACGLRIVVSATEPTPAARREPYMMNDMVSWGGAMMWGMGIYGLLVIVLLVLAIAALIKYLRS
jgi:hypothetical protein